MKIVSFELNICKYLILKLDRNSMFSVFFCNMFLIITINKKNDILKIFQLLYSTFLWKPLFYTCIFFLQLIMGIVSGTVVVVVAVIVIEMDKRSEQMKSITATITTTITMKCS